MFYYLNGKKIDFENIVDIYFVESKNERFFLNIKTTEVKKNLKKEEWNENFYEIPKINKYDKFCWIQEYIEELFYGNNPNLSEEALKVLEQEDCEKAEEILEKSDNYKYCTWKDWATMPAADYIFNWLDNLPVEFKEECEYDCDCPFCLAVIYKKKEDV